MTYSYSYQANGLVGCKGIVGSCYQEEPLDTDDRENEQRAIEAPKHHYTGQVARYP